MRCDCWTHRRRKTRARSLWAQKRCEYVEQAASLLHSFQVDALRRIHSNPVSLFDEWRYLYSYAGLQLRWLRAVRGGCTLQLWGSFDNSQLYRRRQFHSDGCTLKKFHLNLQSWSQVVSSITQRFIVQPDLIVGFGVHEMMHITIGIKVFHLVLF